MFIVRRLLERFVLQCVFAETRVREFDSTFETKKHGNNQVKQGTSPLTAVTAVQFCTNVGQHCRYRERLSEGGRGEVPLGKLSFCSLETVQETHFSTTDGPRWVSLTKNPAGLWRQGAAPSLNISKRCILISRES